MTLSLALTINAVADVALVGGLTWFMSRTAKLTPHVASNQGQHVSLVPAAQAPEAERQERIAA